MIERKTTWFCWLGWLALIWLCLASISYGQIARSNVRVDTISVPSNGQSIIVTFNKPCSGTEELGWTIDASGGAVAVSSGAGSGTAIWTLTTSRDILQAETLTIAHDASVGDIKTTNGNRPLGTFSARTVTNNSQLTESGSPSELQSSSIAANGTDLTMVFTDTVTKTDATGLDLNFSNYAERRLTYSSGSGTNTLVYTIDANPTYTDAETDNDAAPIGATATLTTTATEFVDVTDFAVTNNSTQFPQPDIPEKPDTSLPANWNATADYTPANNTELRAVLNGWTPGEGGVIELTAGVDYGHVNWPTTASGSAGNYIIVRTSEWDNVDWPAHGTRLPATINGNPCTNYMPTISRTVTGSADQELFKIPGGSIDVVTVGNPVSIHTLSPHNLSNGNQVRLAGFITNPDINGTHTVTVIDSRNFTIPVNVISVTDDDGAWYGDTKYVRFIGINFEVDSTTWGDGVGEYYYTTIGVINPCDRIGWDRCRFWWADIMQPIQGWTVSSPSATNIFCIDSRFENHEGAGADNSPTWVYSGKKVLVENNYLQCISNGMFTGDNNNRVVEDITFRRNHVTRPISWNDGTHGGQKAAGFESKEGLRLLIEENSMSNGLMMSGTFAVITIKADGLGGPKDTTHVTVRRNKIYNCSAIGLGFHVSGSSPGTGVGPNFDMLAKQNLIYDVGGRACNIYFDGRMRRIQFLHNTLRTNRTENYNQVSALSTASLSAKYHVFRDNICGGYGAALSGGNVGTGAIAFNSAWGGDYDATHNVFWGESANQYDNDTSPVPLGTLTNNAFPSFGSIGFVDSANDNYQLTPGSTYSSTGASPASDGTDRGCDVAALNAIMAEVEE